MFGIVTNVSFSFKKTIILLFVFNSACINSLRSINSTSRGSQKLLWYPIIYLSCASLNYTYNIGFYPSHIGGAYTVNHTKHASS